jgi:hypothetical protein
MRFWFTQLGRVVGILLLVLSVSQPAVAQRGKGQGKKKGPPAGQNMVPNSGSAPAGGAPGNPAAKQPGKQPGPNAGNAMLGLPPKWVERLQSMTPQEQERFFQNNERFKSLPPERQEQIRRRLQNWNRLSPEQQQELRRREQALEQMTPEQRRYFLQDLGPRLQQMAPDRRLAIRRRLAVLNTLSDAERDARLNNPNFLRGLSPEEQRLLRELSTLRAGPPEPGPDRPPF